MNLKSAPPPDLRIVGIDAVLPHETSDSQRATPLVERLREAELFTNPPVVGAIDQGKYVLMDGANRHQALRQLSFEHILVQVADYESPYVQLDVWQHVISDWRTADFTRELRRLDGVELHDGFVADALAQVLLRGGPLYSLRAVDAASGNATLLNVVETYRRRATLYRTPLKDPAQIWPLYPDAVGLAIFPAMQPSDIVDAATRRDPLPPGVSRHIIHGRALKLNYPMARLRDDRPLDAKNRELQSWMRDKLEQRSLRYYAESTWHFDE